MKIDIKMKCGQQNIILLNDTILDVIAYYLSFVEPVLAVYRLSYTLRNNCKCGIAIAHFIAQCITRYILQIYYAFNLFKINID